MKKYTCIFPRLFNYNLTKDVGMIPFILSDNYNTSIVTYNNDDYFYLENDLKKDNFKLEFVKNTNNEKKDIIQYLKKNSKNIDILQLYHLKYNLIFYYIIIYKIYNKKGKIYLKLDANNEVIDFLVKRKGLMPYLRRLYSKIIFHFIDIISIETKRNYNLLKNIIPEDKLLYVPNGIIKNNTPLEYKENIVLYVGDIEKNNKSIDMLINSIISLNNNQWKLVLIGKIKDDMKDYLEELFKNKLHLKNKIILKGYISNKKMLSEEYAKSSIYCCVSKSESFGISTLEAAYHGNYIISTNVGGSLDIINQTQYGKIIKHNQQELTKSLEYAINNWQKIRQNPYDIQEKVYSKYNWQKLCEKIVNKIEK